MAKCPYCDFNSHVSSNIDHDHWQAAYINAIDKIWCETPDRIVTSVFFGGGTPSLMQPKTIDAILNHIRKRWRQANDVEITLEANPTSIEAEKFNNFYHAGINRVSVGIQALNDTDLRKLGRMHSAKEAITALNTAQSIFERVNFDLIYARQNQSLDDWRAELCMAMNYATDHLSLYQLTIENGTIFSDRFKAGKLTGLPTDDLTADMYELTQEICTTHGYPAYEVSNHAKNGYESRHNLTYWRMQDYAGIGPGAHGRLTINNIRYATEAPKSPKIWLLGNYEIPREILESRTQAQEYLMMGLRLHEGISISHYETLNDTKLPKLALNELLGTKLISINKGRLSVTPNGFLLINYILRRLLEA